MEAKRVIHHACIQGSAQWARLRMGKPTASEFDRVITPKKWEPTKAETRRAYLVHLLTELILDQPLAGVTTATMQAGHDWEPKARAAYEMMHGVDVELCGFVTDDAERIGASPDGFVEDEGSVEIKCPANAETHCGYMIDPGTLVQDYWVQTQGQLYVTGRKWTDLVSYYSGMPMVVQRCNPLPEFQEKLGAALRMFCADLILYIDLARDRGWLKDRKPAAKVDHSKDLVTDEDVEAILAANRLRESRP